MFLLLSSVLQKTTLVYVATYTSDARERILSEEEHPILSLAKIYMNNS